MGWGGSREGEGADCLARKKLPLVKIPVNTIRFENVSLLIGIGTVEVEWNLDSLKIPGEVFLGL